MVTGANNFFVLPRERARILGVMPWCVPVISDGKEILRSDGIICDGPERKVLLRVPRNTDRTKHPSLDAYLSLGENPQGGPQAVAARYIPSHRRPWWYLGNHESPPIVVSYMARQPPVFALNPDGLAILNIAHGLYPKRTMDPAELSDLVQHLNLHRESFRGLGRTYQGGLEKFEPREMEALPIDFARGKETANG